MMDLKELKLGCGFYLQSFMGQGLPVLLRNVHRAAKQGLELMEGTDLGNYERHKWSVV